MAAEAGKARFLAAPPPGLLLAACIAATAMWCIPGPGWGQAKAAVPAPAVAFGSVTMAQARQAMTRLTGNSRYAEWLVAYAESLPAPDGALLIMELSPKAPAPDRAGLMGRSGSLYLLAGRYREAAKAFESAAQASVRGEAQDEWRLLAARCRIGAGEFKAARELGTLVAKEPKQTSPAPSTPPSAPPQAKILLIWAWASLLEGAVDDAWSKASAVLAAAGAAAHEKREAFLIQWLAASARDSSFSMVFSDLPAPGNPEKPAKALLAEYPDSMEAALVSGKIGALTVPWLALGVFPQRAGSSAASAPSSRTSTPVAKTDGGSPAAPAFLQAGWFSRQENAEGMQATLKAKGFKARIERQKSASGESRWAVLVDAEGDWQKTQARLKDSGYESYPAD